MDYLLVGKNTRAGSGCCAIVEEMNGGMASGAGIGRIGARGMRFLPWLLIVSTFLAYANSFSNPFILDDQRVIVGDLRGATGWPAFSSRMVGNLTFRMNHAVGRLNVADYHAVNLLIHVAAGLLLYGLVRRTLLRPWAAGRWTPASAAGSAALTSLLWLLHPMQTESVTYLCQRYESLMGFFVLLTLYAFARAMASGRPRGWCDACIAACAVGMGTKETMGVAPLLVLCYDRTFESGTFRAALRTRPWFYAALACTWGLLAVLGARTLIESMAVNATPLSATGPWVYLGTQAGVVLHYLRLAIVPDALCLYYAWLPALDWRAILLPAVPLLALLVATLWAVRRAPAWGFVGTWFFLTLMPSSSIVPIADMAFEHRMYLPLAALAAAAVFGLDGAGQWCVARWFWRPSRVRVGAGFVLLAVALALGWGTAIRNRTYASSETMWRDIVAKRPDNFPARVELINQLFDSRRLDPVAAAARLDEAEAVTRTLIARIEEVRPREREELKPMPISAEYCRHMAYNQLGRIRLKRDRPDEAEAAFRKAIAMNPRDPLPYNNLALALMMQGRNDEAIRMADAAVREDPGYAKAYGLKAGLLAGQGRFAEAVATYRRALVADPTLISAQSDLAWLLAVCPDSTVRNGAEAVRLASDTVEATDGRSITAFDMLAAAHAECGDFSQAMATQEKAIDLAVRAGRPAEELQRRLQLYRDGKPYRMNPPSE